jgi:hypothetical protein
VVRGAAFWILVSTLVGCSRANTPQANVDASTVIVASPSASAASTQADDASVALAPIKVRGYPHAIRQGMNDPATYVGWTKDGALFGWCGVQGGRPTFVCELVDRNGKTTKKSDESGDDLDPKKKKAILDWLQENGITEIADGKLPPPLAGTWPAAFDDITLDVARIAASGDAPALVRLGGSVGNEPAVYPFSLTKNPVPGAPPHFAVMNGMALSPDGTELGVVAHFHACEYCETFDVKRIPLTMLAASIYNDTGFRAHQSGDFARSAAMFAKAVAADPSHKLAQYNHACALAQLGDNDKAKAALGAVIAKDPSAKTRARTDKDFAKVKSEPWFVDLTR